MSYCDYTVSTGDDCGRPAAIKFIATDLAHYACAEHDQPLYKWLREDKAPYSAIISEFIPSSERPAERCQHPGCHEPVLPAMHGDLNLLLCQEHWAPWCEDGECDQPATYELRLKAPQAGYEPSEPRWACPGHLEGWARSLVRDWHSLALDYGQVRLVRVVRP